MKVYRKVLCETFVRESRDFIDCGWARSDIWVEVDKDSRDKAIEGAQNHFIYTEVTKVHVLDVGPEVASLPSENTWCVDSDGDCVNVKDAS